MLRRSIAPPRAAAAALALGLALATAGLAGRGQEARRQVTIAATSHGYDPLAVEVRENEIVAITFVAKDAPHSLNIDAYRIAKRAEPGRPARFEFRAERAGRFPYYCNLTAATGEPHQMRGELVVRP